MRKTFLIIALAIINAILFSLLKESILYHQKVNELAINVVYAISTYFFIKSIVED